MNKLPIFVGLLLTLSAAAAAAQAQIAQGGDYKLDQSVIAAGGGTSAGAGAGGTYSLTGAVGQAVAGTTSTSAPFAVRGGFFTPQNLAAPTAASVTVGGRARTASGRGIRNVRITLTTADGATRTILSSAFGYYNFTDIAAGQTVILTATGKRFVFSQSTQVLNLTEDAGGVDFVAVEEWFRER